MEDDLIRQLVRVLAPLIEPTAEAVAERVARRIVAEHLAQPPRPLGIDPSRLYSRKEAAELLRVDVTSIWRAENSRGLKRRGPTSRPMYLGADLLKLAKIKTDS